METKKLVLYGIIITVCVFVARQINVDLNLIFAVILIVVSLKIFSSYKSSEKIAEELTDKKYSHITPEPKMNDPETVNLLFYIQDFHKYNPQAYENIVDNIDSFFKIKEIVNRNPQQINQLFEIAEEKKINALNSLHSIVYKLPNDKNVNDKFNLSLEKLESILNDELEEMYTLYRQQLYKGRNRYTREIVIGPKPHNYSTNSSFNFYI